MLLEPKDLFPLSTHAQRSKCHVKLFRRKVFCHNRCEAGQSGNWTVIGPPPFGSCAANAPRANCIARERALQFFLSSLNPRNTLLMHYLTKLEARRIIAGNIFILLCVGFHTKVWFEDSLGHTLECLALIINLINIKILKNRCTAKFGVYNHDLMEGRRWSLLTKILCNWSIPKTFPSLSLCLQQHMCAGPLRENQRYVIHLSGSLHSQWQDPLWHLESTGDDLFCDCCENDALDLAFAMWGKLIWTLENS